VIDLSTGAPVVIAIEDLQWADAETLSWLRALTYALADRASRTPAHVGIVATVCTPTEPPAVAGLVEELRRETICSVLDLDGLDPLQVGELVRSFGFVRASQQLIDTLNEASRGSPLLLQAAARSLLALDAVEHEGGYLVATAPSGALSVAQSLPRAIERDLDTLEPDTLELLVLAALLGDPVECALLARLRSTEPSQIVIRLEVPVSRGLLLTDGTRYRFSQHHLRRAAAERAGGRRAQLHLEIARELAAGDADTDVIDAARHMLEAGGLANPGEVLELSRRAAARASALGAWATAASFCAAAARAMERIPAHDVGEVAALHAEAAAAYHRNQDTGPSLQHWQRVLDLVSGPDERNRLRELRGEALLGLGRTRLGHDTPFGQLLDLTELDEWEAELPPSEDLRRLRVRTAALRSQAFFHAGRGREAEAWGRAALEAAGPGEDDILAQVCMSLGLAQLYAADDPGALEWFEREAGHAARLGDDSQRVRAGSRRALTLYGLGRLREADAEAERVADLAAANGEWADEALALAARAGVAALRGRLGRVERLGRDALMLARRSEYGTANEVLLGIVTSVRIWRREWDDSADALDYWNRASGSTRRRVHGLFIEAGRGDRDAALAGAARVVERLPDAPSAQVLGVAAAVIELAATLEEPALVERPHALLDAAHARGKRVPMGWPALIPRLLGTAERLLGQRDAAEAHLREAMALAEAEEAHAELAIAALELAQLRAPAAGGAEVSALARRAAALLHELGIEARAAEADALVARLDVPPPGHRQRYPGGLSPREVEVLRALTRGLTNDQIAEALVISPATARRHVSNIYLKLDVTNRAGAARFCVEQGLADDDDSP
jgi:DNA-binding NarL/FixJ family response regulator